MIEPNKKLADEAPRLSPGDVVVIATSPKAGSGAGRERIGQLRDRLAGEGLRVSVHTDVLEVIRQVREGEQSGGRVVLVAAGGDGTLNLMASVTERGLPIVPFPLGTENLVARHYGLTARGGGGDPQRAAETVLRGCHRWVDAGIALFPRPRWAEPRRRMFLVMASVGFDAEVVRRMHLSRRGHIRRWSYFKPIWAMLRKYRYPPIQVTGIGDDADPLTVAWALVFNLPRYAAGLGVETMADEADGLLDFLGLSRGSHVQGMRYLSGVLVRRHHRWADVWRRRGTGFRFSSEAPLAVQLDGDYAGRLPMEVRVDPARVLLRLPRQGGGGNP